MNNIVGTYKSKRVYRVTLPEYVNGRLYKDEENIYLINGELIYKNEIFAKLDGNYVTEYDPNERATFYTVPKSGAGTDPIPAIKVEDRGTKVSFSTGTAEGDIVSNFQPEDVTDVLTSVYEIDYFSGMTDIDAFLKSNS